MNSFGDKFYPTPSALIMRMLAPLLEEHKDDRYWIRSRIVLEPSAGKGDILDYLKNVHQVENAKLFAIEIAEELRLILTGKGYRVVDGDFLKYADNYFFNLIVMNPPFSDGVDHPLKAWDILAEGDVVCLLNAESVLNPHTEKRKLLMRLIEQHGRYEVIGSVFKNAECKTDVNTVIVWLHKDGVKGVEFDAFKVDVDTPEAEAAFAANPLASNSVIETLVSQYTAAADLLRQRHAINAKYAFYIKGVVKEKVDVTPASLNAEINELKQSFWKYVFEKTKLGSVTTSNFRRKFDEFAAQTAMMAFNETNIRAVLEMFFLNRGEIMQQCITDVFDKATTYHEKNKVHTEGWKTNKSWKIAPKIIMRHGVTFDPRWGGHWSFVYQNREFYNDLDKALCFLTGKVIASRHWTEKDKPLAENEVFTIADAIEAHLTKIGNGKVEYDALFSSTFFDIRVFKKGTVHLIWRDAGLLARFNAVAAKGKNWVGEGDNKPPRKKTAPKAKPTAAASHQPLLLGGGS